jgi:protein SMG6
MAVAAMVSGGVRAGGLGGQLTSQAVSEASTCADQSAEGRKEKKNSSNSTKSLSDRPAARIDDSPSPSIGIAAARLMDIEPEKERRGGVRLQENGMVQVWLNSLGRGNCTTIWDCWKGTN